MTKPNSVESVSAIRWRVAMTLTAAMMVAYFGFILLVAFQKPFLAARLGPGLSVGMLLGVGVIIVAWALTWTYVRWANHTYDRALAGLRR
jgi:uncharacterized membrane protein (DUF485 family)